MNCDMCNLKFDQEKLFNRHNWIYHPSNFYEITWSKLYHSGKLSSYCLAYQDDPYY